MEFKWDKRVPQISRMNTDFLTYSVRFTQISWPFAGWAMKIPYSVDNGFRGKNLRNLRNLRELLNRKFLIA